MEKCLYRILTVLHVSTGCDLVENKKINITAYTGDSVLLPCYCTDLHTKPERFSWNKYNRVNQNWEVIISSESDQKRNRFQLVNVHSPGNLSLLISHLTEEDGGVYRCELESSGEYTDIRFAVKGCDLVENKKTVYITAYTGDSVLLPCYCSELRAKPGRFSWRKHNEANKIWNVIISSKSDQNRNRFQLVNVHSPGNLSLLISHLTEEDGGGYRCSITNRDYKDIILTVEDTTFTSALSAPSADASVPPDQTSTITLSTPSGDGKDDEKTTTPPSSTLTSQSRTTPSPDSPQSLPFIPFALVTVVFLHIIVAVVYCIKKSKASALDPARVYYSFTDGDATVSLQ